MSKTPYSLGGTSAAPGPHGPSLGGFPIPQQNMWWIVANDNDPVHGWHWDQFFENPADPEQTDNWGGPNWLRSNVSFIRIEEMRRGDLVAAYQAGEGILGMAMLASDGYRTEETGKYDTFDLASSPALRFRMPIPYKIIRDLRASKDDFEFVRIAKQGSVFRISQAGQVRLLQLAREFNPSQAADVDRFLRAA